MLTFDKYAYNNRLVHIHPIIKGVIYLLLLGISFSEIPSLQLGLLIAIAPLTCYVAHVYWVTYSKWVMVTFPFVFLSLVTVMVSFSNRQQEMLISIPLFNGFMGVTQHSVIRTSIILLRVYCSLLSTYFFILTVPFQQLLILLRYLRLPRFLLDIIVLMYRFIFLFIHEFIVMRDTLDLKFGFGTFKQSYKSMGLLANQFFTRLMKTNEHLNHTLEMRFDTDI